MLRNRCNIMAKVILELGDELNGKLDRISNNQLRTRASMVRFLIKDFPEVENGC